MKNIILQKSFTFCRFNKYTTLYCKAFAFPTATVYIFIGVIEKSFFTLSFLFFSANEKLKHVDVYCKYCKNKNQKQNIFHMKTSNNYRRECEKWMEKAFFQYCCLCYKQTTSHDFVFSFCVERSTTNLYDI